MNHLKMLGLAAVAAAALTALVGTGSASATVLCKATETPCLEFNKYPVGTFAHGSLAPGTSAAFKTTGGDTVLTCTNGTIKGELSQAGSATQTPSGTGSAANVNWTGCDKTMHTISGGEIEVHHITGTDNGTVIVKNFQTTINLFGVSCTYGYGAGTDIGVLTGGKEPTLDIKVVLNKTAGGFICPTHVVGEALGVLTEPTELPVYVEPE
jgi:hypothetical protein